MPDAQTYAAAQLIRQARNILNEASGELARAHRYNGWSDEDYQRYNERCDRLGRRTLDGLAAELEAEAWRLG